MHLALFGGIIYVDRPLRLAEKAGAMVIYLAFAVLNFRVMSIHMGLLHNVYREVAALESDQCCSDSQLVAYVATDLASGRFSVAEGVLVRGHLLMAGLVVTSTVLDRAIGAKNQRTAAPSNDDALSV